MLNGQSFDETPMKQLAMLLAVSAPPCQRWADWCHPWNAPLGTYHLQSEAPPEEKVRGWGWSFTQNVSKKRHQAFHKLPFCNGGWIMLNQILLICKFQMVDQFESCNKHWAGFWCQAIESRSGLMTLSRHAMVGVAHFVHQDWKPVVKEGVNDTFELCFTFISKKS